MLSVRQDFDQDGSGIGAAVNFINGIFALAYGALGDGALDGASTLGLDDPFLRAFTYSVGVFSTNGIGPMHAVGLPA